MTRFIRLCSFLFFLSGSIQAQQWTHVGPKSNNIQNGNGFETSQLNNIVKDPNNDNHFFAGGRFAGLWESFDACSTWTPINTNFNLACGISAVIFLNSNELLISSNAAVINKVSKYNFVTDTWTALGAIPNPNGIKFDINNIVLDPANANNIFLCTSVGLIKSTNNGASWTRLVEGYFESLIVVPYTYGSYKYYASGSANEGFSYTFGSLKIIESNDGQNFAPLSTLNIDTGYPYNYGLLCAGPVNGSSHELYLQVFATSTDWDNGRGLIYKINITPSSRTVALLAVLPGNSSGTHTPSRTALIYDAVNDGVFVGGMKLRFVYDNGTYYDNIRASKHMTNGNIHNDIHDLKIYNINGQNKLYAACDGGLASSPLNTFNGANPSSYLSFTGLNNELHVCLVNGFSGSAQEPNLYAIGGQDIVNTDVYDASLGKNIATHETWENDGTYIDKFNSNNMFFDYSSYSSMLGYYTSTDRGLSKSTLKNFYWAGATPTFTKGAISSINGEAGFTSRLFFQDPFRRGRIFHVKLYSGIYQYVEDPNPVNSAFVNKIWHGSIEPTPGAFGIDGWSNPAAMSFSPQTINSLHFVINGATNSRPSVIKYVGKNIEDCWRDHNAATYTDATGTHPQWATLTGAGMWESFGISAADIAGIKFLEIETSPWNKDVVYTLVNVPNNPHIKVLKYNGTSWSNISSGIPLGETPWSMIMDYASNDALYMATSHGVYYKHGTSSNWTSFTDPNLPILRCTQMEINYQDNSLRVSTYGRGIWKSPLACPPLRNPVNNAAAIPANIYESDDITVSKNTLQNGAPTAFRASKYVELLPGFLASGITTENRYVTAYIHGCTTPGTSSGYRSMNNNSITEGAMQNTQKINEINIHPNPTTGKFNIDLGGTSAEKVTVFDALGKVIIENNVDSNAYSQSLDLSGYPSGIYFIKVSTGAEIIMKKLIKR